MRSLFIPVLGATLLQLSRLQAQTEVTIQSGPAQVHLIELYTSEGCSSCPSGERWLSSLKGSPYLWNPIVPVAFHVDYWDYLGWKDKLATPAHTARQRAYARTWKSSTVYTPGFVLNGREWRTSDTKFLSARDPECGMLSATLREDGTIDITYQPPKNTTGPWEATAVLLGSGITTPILAGENKGATLPHDFAVLAQKAGAMSARGTSWGTTLTLPPKSQTTAPKLSFAVWVSKSSAQAPVQAAGGEW